MDGQLKLDVGRSSNLIDGRDDGAQRSPTTERTTSRRDPEPAPAPRRTPRQPIPPARLRRLLILSDAAAIACGLLIATTVQGRLRPVGSSIALEQLRHAALVLPVWLLLMGANRLFTARALVSRSEELRRLLITCALGTGALIMAGFATQFTQLSRLWVALVFVSVTGVLLVSRTIARRSFAWLRERGYSSRPVVVVGTGTDAVSVLHATQRHPELGYRVLGLMGDDIGERGGVRVLGPTADTLQVVEATGAIGAILSVPSLEPSEVNVLTRQLSRAGYHVTLSSALHDIDIARTRPQEIDGRLMIHVEPTKLSGWRPLCKRAFDVTIASFALLVTSPLIALAALAVKLESRGPVVFSQIRVGRGGVPFRILKLRTMVADAERQLAELADRNEVDGPLFKMRDDPRITRVGKILRKTSIDELPQLWNVLRGEMSIVGPRPALPHEAAQWTPDLQERLQVLPGITGLWQVSGRSDSDFEMYKRLDLYYVDNWNLLRDLSIVARTFGVVVFGKGAH